MTEWEAPLNQRMFVAALAKMVAPMQTAEAVNAMLAMLPALKHLPDSVFERPGDLAAQIGVDMDRVPTLARLRKALDIWHEANKPKAVVLPDSVDATDLPATDRALVRFWLRDFAEGKPRQALTISLSVLRRHAPSGYRWLLDTRSDGAMLAAEIAVTQRWGEAEHRWTPPTEEEKAAVAVIVRPYTAAMDLPTGENRTPTPQQYADMRSDEGVVVPSKSASAESPAASGPAGTPPDAHVQARRLENALLKPFAEQKAARQAEIDAGAIYEDYLPEATPEPEPEPEPEPLRAAAQVIPMRKKRAPMPYDDDEVPA